MRKREVSGLTTFKRTKKAPNRNIKLRIRNDFTVFENRHLVAIDVSLSFVIKFDQFSLHCHTRHSVPKYSTCFIFILVHLLVLILKSDDTFF